MAISAQPAQLLPLGALRAALLAELEPQITQALQVAVLLAAGFRREEIVRRLGVSPLKVDQAKDRLKRACARLDVGDATGPRAA